jgi:hypothetical protein
MLNPLRFTVFTLAVVVAANVSVGAQASEDDAAFNTATLGISLERIQYKLDRLPSGDQASSLLRLDFYVEVYAEAPEINYFQGFDLQNAPIAHGVPAHDQMMAVMSPGRLAPILGPAMNLSNGIAWLLSGGR